MKKIIVSVTIILLLILTVIIGYNVKTYSGVLVCTNTYNEDDISFKTTYHVEYKKRYATKLVSVETIKTQETLLLNDYKTNLEMMYLRFNEIPHYNNTISIKDDTLTSKTIINYSKIDLNKLIKVDSSFNEVIKNNKISITKLKEQYASTGALCKYKN